MTTIYQSEGVPGIHVGNPLITALPPEPSFRGYVKAMSRKPPDLMEAIMSEPQLQRRHSVAYLDDMYLPTSLTVDYAREVDFAIRRGYVKRNPLSAEGQLLRYTIQKQINGGLKLPSQKLMGCMFLMGPSGSGKSQTNFQVFSRFPKVIEHTNFNGAQLNEKQIVWLSVEGSSSLKTILLSIIEDIDRALGEIGTPMEHGTAVNDRTTIGQLLRTLGQLFSTYSVGIIHIDDAQRLCESKQSVQEILGSIVSLANVARIPIVFSGTEDALPLFGGSFEVARRVCSLGGFEMNRPADSQDPVFQAAVAFLLSFQLVENRFEPTQQDIEVLYDLSKGVMSVLKGLHVEAQKICLWEANGPATLMINHYVDAAVSRFGLLRPHLEKFQTASNSAQKQGRSRVRRAQ